MTVPSAKTSSAVGFCTVQPGVLAVAASVMAALSVLRSARAQCVQAGEILKIVWLRPVH
jgi:hypothetical protein